MSTTGEEDQAPSSPNNTTQPAGGESDDSSEWRINPTGTFVNVVVASLTKARPLRSLDPPIITLVNGELKENSSGSYREPMRTAIFERFRRYAIGTQDPKEVRMWDRDLRYWQLATPLPHNVPKNEKDDLDVSAAADKQLPARASIQCTRTHPISLRDIGGSGNKVEIKTSEYTDEDEVADKSRGTEESGQSTESAPVLDLPLYPHRHSPPQRPYSAPPHLPEPDIDIVALAREVSKRLGLGTPQYPENNETIS